MRKVIEEGPWSIMGNCMVVKEWKKGEAVEKVMFTKIEFWIQIHNLPIEMMTSKNAEMIGNKIGRSIKIYDQWIMDGVRRDFLRIRVGLKVENPLVEGFWVPRGDKGRRWIQIKYVKLLEFCFACRRLGHL